MEIKINLRKFAKALIYEVNTLGLVLFVCNTALDFPPPLIVTLAQITESVFNFSKAVPVVNQSRQEVRQPGFLAIIGLKLADGRPPSWKYKMDNNK